MPPLGASGKAAGNSITLQLIAPAEEKAIAYLSGKHWDGRHHKLLNGTSGIAATLPISILAQKDQNGGRSVWQGKSSRIESK